MYGFFEWNFGHFLVVVNGPLLPWEFYWFFLVKQKFTKNLMIGLKKNYLVCWHFMRLIFKSDPLPQPCHILGLRISFSYLFFFLFVVAYSLARSSHQSKSYHISRWLWNQATHITSNLLKLIDKGIRGRDNPVVFFLFSLRNQSVITYEVAHIAFCHAFYLKYWKILLK